MPERPSPRRRRSHRAGAVCVAALLAAALVLALAGCRGGRSTPELTYETIRAAVATRDPRLYYEVHQGEIRAVARQSVREWRARIARGERVSDVLAGAGGITEEELRQGTEEDAAGWVLVHFSHLTPRTRWYENAVVAKTAPDGDAAACLTLRGADGSSSDLWLVREAGGWAIDTKRTWLRKPQ